MKCGLLALWLAASLVGNAQMHWRTLPDLVDTVYVLERNARTWCLAGKLPPPLPYGAAVDVADGMVLLGGQTPDWFSAAVLHFSLKRGVAEIRRLADLPAPMAMMSAAAAGGLVYLAGLAFDARSGAWIVAGEAPVSLVTTGIARWGDELVIAGGEDRPGHRSAQVVSATIQPGRQF